MFVSVNADALLQLNTMEAPDTSSTSTCSSLLTSPDPDEYDEHNMWNPMLGLFVMIPLAQYGGIF